ncbi:MAG: hypothetical protein WCF85_12220 [Rhodospirillaceae bacterium]
MMKLEINSLLSKERANESAWDCVVSFVGGDNLTDEESRELHLIEKTAEDEKNEGDFLWRGFVRSQLTIMGMDAYKALLKVDRAEWAYEKVLADHNILRNLLDGKWKGRVDRCLRFFELAESTDSLINLTNEAKQLDNGYCKIKWTMKKFKGYNIGSKYARNIWLDINDIYVGKGHIAIDSRIMKLITMVWTDLDTLTGRILLIGCLAHEETYRNIELALMEIAHAANISGFYLDKRLFLSYARWKGGLSNLMCPSALGPDRNRVERSQWIERAPSPKWCRN